MVRLRHEPRRTRSTLWVVWPSAVPLSASKVRCAAQEGSAELDEIQMHAAQRLWKYNHSRPDMALGGITPKQ